MFAIPSLKTLSNLSKKWRCFLLFLFFAKTEVPALQASEKEQEDLFFKALLQTKKHYERRYDFESFHYLFFNGEERDGTLFMKKAT